MLPQILGRQVRLPSPPLRAPEEFSPEEYAANLGLFLGIKPEVRPGAEARLSQGRL